MRAHMRRRRPAAPAADVLGWPRHPRDQFKNGLGAAMVRIDSTVTEALMHEPTDSSLLWDAVRVMTRLLKRARALGGTVAIAWRDQRRLAKKRAQAIEHSRGRERKVKLYRELLAATRATKEALERTLAL